MKQKRLILRIRKFLILRQVLQSVILVLLLISIVSADEGIELTLQDAVRMAIENNLGLKVERYNPKIVEQEIAIEKAVFDPVASLNLSESYEKALSPSVLTSSEQRTLDINLTLTGKVTTGTEYTLKGDYQRFRGNSGFLTLNPYHLTELSLTVSQPLLKNFGRAIQTTMIEVSKHNRAIAGYGLKKTAEELAEKSVRAYLNVLIAREAVRDARLSLRLAKETLKEVKAKIEAGVLPRVEIYKAEAELALREEALLKAENNLKDQIDALKMILNIDWQKEIRITEPSVDTDRYPSLDESVELALLNRTDLKEAREEIKKMELLSRFYKNQALPDLELFSTVGISGLGDSTSEAFDRLDDTDSRNWTIGLSLQIPLFLRAEKARYMKARYEQERAQASLEEARRKAVLEVRRAWRKVILARKRIDAMTKTRVAAEKRLQAEQGRFSEGLATLIDVLKFQQEYTESLLEEKKAVYDYLLALTELEKTKGTILHSYGVKEDFFGNEREGFETAER